MIWHLLFGVAVGVISAVYFTQYRCETDGRTFLNGDWYICEREQAK